MRRRVGKGEKKGGEGRAIKGENGWGVKEGYGRERKGWGRELLGRY